MVWPVMRSVRVICDRRLLHVLSVAMVERSPSDNPISRCASAAVVSSQAFCRCPAPVRPQYHPSDKTSSSRFAPGRNRAVTSYDWTYTVWVVVG